MNRPLIRIALLIIFAGISGACTNNAKDDVSEWNVPELELKHQRLFPDIEILMVGDLITTANKIIVQRASRDGEFSVFQFKGDSLLYGGSFLHLGRAEYEVNAARAHYVPEDNKLVIAGYNPTGRYIVIPLERFDNVFDMDSWNMYDEPVRSSFLHSSATPIDGTRYIAQNYDDRSDNIFVSFDVRDSMFSEVVLPYPKNADLLSLEDKQLRVFSITYLKKRPGHNQFVYCFQNGQYAEIFSLDDDNHSVTGHVKVFENPPKFNNMSDKTTLERSVRLGFRVWTSGDHIYYGDPELRSGYWQQDIESNGFRPGYVKRIYVSDWQGEPVAKIMVDIPIADYAVDPQGKYLYASSYDPETLEDIIVRFSLPNF